MEIQEIISSNSDKMKPEKHEPSGSINEKDNSFNDHLDRASSGDDDYDIAAKKADESGESEKSRRSEDDAVDDSKQLSDGDSEEVNAQKATSDKTDDVEVEASTSETDDNNSEEVSFAEAANTINNLQVNGDGKDTVEAESSSLLETTGDENVLTNQLPLAEDKNLNGSVANNSNNETESPGILDEVLVASKNGRAGEKSVADNSKIKGNTQTVARSGGENIVTDNAEQAPPLMESVKKMSAKESREGDHRATVNASSQKGEGAGSTLNIPTNATLVDQNIGSERSVATNPNEPLLAKGGEGKPDTSSLSTLIQKGDAVQADSANKSDQNGFKLIQKAATSDVDKSMTMSKLVSDGTKGEVKITLNPPSLGRLQIELSLQDNNVKALFVTESNSVKSILESNMQDFKDSLSDRDVNLESFDVSTNSKGSENEDEDELIWQSLSHDDSSGVKGEEKYRLYEGDYSNMNWQGLNIFV